MNPIPVRYIHYRWEANLYSPRTQKKLGYDFGPSVVSRDTTGIATSVRVRVYSHNKNERIFLVGKFNNWGDEKTSEDELVFSQGFHEITTTKLEHKDAYLFLVQQSDKTQFRRDPAARYFDDKGNCIFWDFADPKAYKMKHSRPDVTHNSSIILQSDPVGLVGRWFTYDKNAVPLADSSQDLFTYIATCGVLEKIKSLGFNTIQFLPISQSIDGDNWKFRYLSPFPFALQKNFGTPDSFAFFVDTCHKLGIAVILDTIISHAPYKDFQMFGLAGETCGLHTWRTAQGDNVLLHEKTNWGSQRFRYEDSVVRSFLSQSVAWWFDAYAIDGVRIDNVDGILRRGPHGQGKDRKGGRECLQKTIKDIYTVYSHALVHLESHYFYEENAKLLVAPQQRIPKALGATAYNSSRLTYYFHTVLMPKSADQLQVQQFYDIAKEKEWGKSNSTIADFHNHDAAAGLMEMRATGSYAYDALTLGNPHLHKHAVGKIKTMLAIIAFGCEGRILNLVQTFLLQQGSFEHDCSIHWERLAHQKSKEMIGYMKKIHAILKHPAFWPENTINRTFIITDDEKKVLGILREDSTQGTKDSFMCLINCSSQSQHNIILPDQFDSYQEIFSSVNISTNKQTNNTVLEAYEVKILKKQ